MATGLDPLTVATQGLLSNNTLLYAVQGLLSVEIEIVTPDDEVISGGGGIVDDAWQDWSKEEKKKLRAKITVTAVVDGKEYKESHYTSDLTVKVKDVEIDIDRTAPKPKITISVKK